MFLSWKLKLNIFATNDPSQASNLIFPSFLVKQDGARARVWDSTDHIDLGVGVSHIADDAAVLHAVQVLPNNHVLIAWEQERKPLRIWEEEEEKHHQAGGRRSKVSFKKCQIKWAGTHSTVCFFGTGLSECSLVLIIPCLSLQCR